MLIIKDIPTFEGTYRCLGGQHDLKLQKVPMLIDEWGNIFAPREAFFPYYGGKANEVIDAYKFVPASETYNSSYIGYYVLKSCPDKRARELVDSYKMFPKVPQQTI